MGSSGARGILAHRLVSSILMGIAALAVVTVAPSSGQSWPTYRGPSMDGSADGGLPDGEAPLRLKTHWKVPIGSGYSGISIAGGALVTGFAAEGQSVIAAFDPESGRERWRYDLGPVYVGHDGSHDGPIATPVIHESVVYMLDAHGLLVALGLETGELLWQVHLKEDLEGIDPEWGFCASPLVAGGVLILYASSEAGGVVGLEPTSGDLLWRTSANVQECASPVVAEVEGRPHLIVQGLTEVSGLDPEEGTVLWQIEHGGNDGYSDTPLPLGESRFLIGHAWASSRAVSVENGQPELHAATRSMGSTYGDPVFWNGVVYGFTSRFLSALDPVEGKELWRSRAPGDGFLIAVQGRLIVLTKNGSLHLADADPSGWNEIDRIELFEELTWTPPSFAEGAVYVRSLNEMARIDVVAESTQTTEQVTEPTFPSLLALKRTIEGGGDADRTVDKWLADRETPIVNGEQVLFVWRGQAEDVGIGGDMLGIRLDEPMQRLPGTDLWWWETTLDRRARASYAFFVDYTPTLDPLNPRHVKSTLIGPDMDVPPVGDFEMSWFSMPEGPGEREAHLQPATAGKPQGRLETLTVEMVPTLSLGKDESEPVEVPVKVWLPPGYDDSESRYPVAFVHGPGALEEGLWDRTLDHLVGQTVAPLLVVFVELPRDMWPEYNRHVSDELLPLVDERYRSLPGRENRASVGMGWWCVDAMTLALESPHSFGRLGLQSVMMLERERVVFRAALSDSTAETVPLRIYLDWGEWDIRAPTEGWDTRASAEETFEVFSERGWKPMGGKVFDSTDWISWSSRTDELLEALFPLASSR